MGHEDHLDAGRRLCHEEIGLIMVCSHSQAILGLQYEY